MAITAAAVEANGWVLRLTLTAGLGSIAAAPDTAAQWSANFAAYALAPNSAAPAVTLAATSAGFTQSAGQAVPASTLRSLIAAKVLRKPVQSGNAAGTRVAKVPDEVDNGNGTITVRIALSQHVYAGDTGLTLAVLAGWRSGEAAQSGIVVTNNSTVAAPAPIVRWSDVSYQLQSGSFGLEVVVAAHHPNALAPVAGVRFTVTDGTTVKTFWATALSSSTAYSAGGTGQPLRVYAATVDPTTATALTQGLLRCDFEVYPWIGPLQASDKAGTRSMTGLGTAALATSAFVPFVVAYSPGAAWIVPRFIDIDEVNGTTTPASVTVGTTAAAAAAGTPAANIITALQAIYTLNVTVVAANGQAAITRSADGVVLTIRKANAGTGCTGVSNGVGTASVTAGLSTGASWPIVRSDPTDPTGRACIFRSPATINGVSRLGRLKVDSLSVEAQTNAVAGCIATWVSNVELRGVAGQEATSGLPFSLTNALLWATNFKWWRHGTGPTQSGVSQTPVLLRNGSSERSFTAPVVLNCARLPSGLASNTGVVASNSSTDAGLSLERMIVGCDLRYLNGANAFGAASLPNAAAAAIETVNYGGAGKLTFGKTYPVVSRQAWLNNVAEIYGTAQPLLQGWGENNPCVSSEFIVEGNTFTGDRDNTWYNDLNLATVALNDSEDCKYQTVRWANNIALKHASKQDAFDDPVVKAQRIGVALSTTRNKAYVAGAQLVVSGSPAQIYQCAVAGTTASTAGPTGTTSGQVDGGVTWNWVASEARKHGYRPQATGGWSVHYGVGFEGNIDYLGVGDPTYDTEFAHEFYGIGSQRLADDGLSVSATPFTLDNSGTPNKLVFQAAPDGTGGGDYKPLNSPAGAYALRRAKTANVDVDSRGVARVVPFAAGAIEGAVQIAVTPAAARQASRAGSSVAGWTASLAAASARQSSRAAAGLVGWSANLAVAGSRLVSRAAVAIIQWRASLAVDSDRSASLAASGQVMWRANLAPASGRSATQAAVSGVTAIGPWLVVIDGGRIAVVDRTQPLLPPGTVVPPDRTLIVSGDLRTTIVP